jgi:low affinity Fe/Cu permease
MAEVKRDGVAPEGSSPRSFSDRFRSVSDRITQVMGTPWTLLVAVALIVVWALTGPIFGFSDTWQLVINTTTTIITFLMVFVIQTSQNRESKAIQLKLDELIMANERARNRVILADKDSEQELLNLEKDFDKVAADVPDGPQGEGKAPERPKRASGTASTTTGTASRKR